MCVSSASQEKDGDSEATEAAPPPTPAVDDSDGEELRDDSRVTKERSRLCARAVVPYRQRCHTIKNFPWLLHAITV